MQPDVVWYLVIGNVQQDVMYQDITHPCCDAQNKAAWQDKTCATQT